MDSLGIGSLRPSDSPSLCSAKGKGNKGDSSLVRAGTYVVHNITVIRSICMGSTDICLRRWRDTQLWAAGAVGPLGLLGGKAHYRRSSITIYKNHVIFIKIT